MDLPEEYDHDEEPEAAPGFRTYEVYQRERVGETTNLIKPRQLISNEYLEDPYPLLKILRENYPCYRDWLNNRFWITRYDDVTSVFTDDRNFETRPKSWQNLMKSGSISLWQEVEVQREYENLVDRHIRDVVDEVLSTFSNKRMNLATEFCIQVPLRLFGKVIGIPEENMEQFMTLYWKSRLINGWNPSHKQSGISALQEMETMVGEICAARLLKPQDDLITSIIQNTNLNRDVTAQDAILTLLDIDQDTFIGGLSNLWFNLLANPTEMEKVLDDRRMLKFAWLETLRFSPPVLSAERFAKYEIERFGRLIPQGGLLMCSAAAANRDPRQFNDPDKFIVGRKDLCQREPRGQYRADGLPSGIAFSLGKPSIYPAVPKERARSMYAIVRDSAVIASELLLHSHPDLKLQKGTNPKLTALNLRDIHTCWDLSIEI